MKRSICKLCLQEADLQDSHLLPRAIYKLFRSSASPNVGPIHVSAKNVFHTSSQVKAHLLCTACENLLNRRGERWVLPLIAQPNGQFPLNQILLKTSPDVAFADTLAFSACKNPEINVDALAHFALGVFWKASVHDWSRSNGNEQINVGPFAEKLRSSLISGNAVEVPEGFELTVGVLPTPVKANFAYSPISGGKHNMVQSYHFYVPGILFTLALGREITPEACFIRNPLHPIILSDLSSIIEEGPRTTYFEGKAAKARRSRPGTPIS